VNLRFILVAMLCFAASVDAAEPPRGTITIERISQIKYPSGPAWSPDSKSVAFLWDAWGKQDLFIASPGSKPQALTDFPVNPDIRTSDIASFAWLSEDEILFVKDGVVYTVSPRSQKPTRYEGFADAANFVLSPDKKYIAFTRSGQLWFGAVGTKVQRQLTNIPGLAPTAPVFSPDGGKLAFITTSGGATPAPETMAFNGTRMSVIGNPDPTRIGGIGAVERKIAVVSTFGGDVKWIAVSGIPSALQFTAADGLVWAETSADGKVRDIKTATADGTAHTLWRDRDERWFSPTPRDSKVLLSPDGKTVAFVSDRTGWVQIYAMPVTATAESQAKQLTRGSFLSGLGSWSKDSRKIAYHRAGPDNPMERFIDVVDVNSGRAERIVTARGVNYDPIFAPDGLSLVVHRTDTENALDLYTVPVKPGASLTRLSDSMPAGLDKKDLTAPVMVSYPSRLDKKPVPATLMVADSIDRSKKHPALVWIHGSGSDQNFIGWHPGSYRMYYALCQYLAQQGYVILTPDYRGSSGYSRDWSTGVHGAIGVGDTADVAAGADYLKTLEYVDPDRIGVFGLSYGGFLTLQALVTDPTLWRSGVNVAGVVDWATYGGGYTWPRLGTPVQNPEIYEVSAPIKHMDKLARPLLIMHGTNDVNVSFIDSLRLFDQLIKLGKPFESQIYPGEIHFFRRDIVLRDAWRRIEEFFERTVKN